MLSQASFYKNQTLRQKFREGYYLDMLLGPKPGEEKETGLGKGEC